MKTRNIKLAACLLVSTMIITMGAAPVNAASVNKSTITTENNGTSGLVSGVSRLLAEVNEQSAEQASVPVPAADTEQEEEQEAVETEDTQESDDSYANIGVSLEDNLNIRSEATTDSDVVGKLQKNAVATVEEEQDGWYKVTSGSIKGYVKAEYLSVGDKELIDSVKFRVAEVETETLKVRSEASTDASVISLVGLEDKLSVLDEQTEGWVKVKNSDGEGFVAAEYVSVYDTYQYAEKPVVEEASTSSGSSSVAGYALQFVGNPYVWGGTSLTNGADCSGFVMSVYAHYGVSLPHSSSALRGVGRGVSYSEAQPGDIICYSGHVAIYIGGGQIVHASNPNDGIKVSSATYKSILAVRRVLN